MWNNYSNEKNSNKFHRAFLEISLTLFSKKKKKEKTRLETWKARQEPMGIIVITSDGQPRRPKGSGRVSVSMVSRTESDTEPRMP